ncbi:MAG TPA: hypothetical protein ENH46_05680 [Candidatus Pacearchaeota archaeon]|nr:hypothetical protein [Candidatus Pacearchaeota archaeon]
MEINLNNFKEVKSNNCSSNKKIIRITKAGIYLPTTICSANKVKIRISGNMILFNFSDEGFCIGANGKSINNKRISMSKYGSRLKRIIFDEYRIKPDYYKFEKLEIDGKTYYKIEFEKEIKTKSEFRE